MKKIIFCLIFFVGAKYGYGAADFDVERVNSPYVESKDVGPMMQSEGTQHMMRKTSTPYRSYSTLNRLGGAGCATCQYGMGGGSTGSSSQSSSSYSYQSAGGSNPIYSHPPISSSSRHEMKKEKEFQNGQQVYDFHHERKYQDGKLIDEKRHEKTPENFGIQNQPKGSMQYSAYSSWSNMPSSNVASESSYSSGSSYSMMPQTSYQQNQYQESRQAGYELDNNIDDHFDDDFDREIEKMREELRRRTLSGSASTHLTSPTYGGSHKSEFRKETKYVNGKPVYMLNEEKKYKDGKLIHNVRDEKGPEDLGTTDALSSSPVLTYPTGEVYSRHEEEIHKSQSQLPAARYPSVYRPSYGSAESSSIYSSSNQQPHYRPSSVYSSERVQERTETQKQSHGNYYPNSYQPSRKHDDDDNDDLNDRYRQSQSVASHDSSYYRPATTTIPITYTTASTPRPSSIYSSERVQERTETQKQLHGNYYPNSYYPSRKPDDDDDNDDLDERYRQSQSVVSRDSSYYRPATTIIPITYTTTTTPRPSYVPHESSPTYNSGRYNPRPASSNHQYEEQSSSTYYSNNQPVETPERHNYSPENVNTYRPYDSKPDSEEKIREASESSYYELTARRNRPDSESQPDQFPSYRTGTFSKSTENRESETSHQSPTQQNRITESTRTYQPEVHASTTKEEHSKTVSSSYYPTSHNVQRARSHERERNVDENSPGVGSPTSNYGVPGFISGPEPEHDTASEEEDERYDISPYDDASDKVKAETETNNVQFEGHPSQRPFYRSPRLPEPDRLTDNQQGYSIFNSTRTDHVTKMLPSRWVETKTSWKYMNGKLVSETQHHRYYENGILIHENSTRRTRDELEADGINVLSLDLTASQLSEYGPAIASSSHSQKHEMHQIKRFRNGQQIYELNHEKRFQDGNLVHDKREEKDEDDFGVPNYEVDDYQHNQDHNYNRHSLASESELYKTGALQTVNVNPQSYSRKHEVRQEEEFVNGQKIYDLHHEREYHDGKLIRENKTELGPDNLGTQRIEHRDALKDLLSGHTQSSVAHNALLEQQRTADSVLKTSCITCGVVHGSTQSQGSILSSHGIPATHGYNAAGSSYRQDLNIEEHYEDGQLVKGREAKKKWQDGQLIDAKEEHYYGGPSRANISTSLVPGFSSSAAMSAFSSGPAESTQGSSDSECSYNPCRNKGTCKESVRGPICICVFGFKGTYCEEAYCPSRYCRYGGSCSIEDDKHVCGCREGYSGYRCSVTHHKIRLGVSG